MNDFFKFFKPIKYKMMLENAINCGITYLTFGFILCSIAMIVSKFIFIERLYTKLAVILILATLFSFINVILKKPDIVKLALVGDSFGFQERFVTAIEIIQSGRQDETVCKLAIEDAFEMAKSADFKKMYRIKVDYRKYILLSLSILTTFLVGFIPNSNSDKMQIQMQLQSEIDIQTEKVDKLIKDIENDEIKKELKDLKSELKKANSESAILDSIQKSKRKLKMLENKSIPQSLKQLGKKLESNESTKDLGKSIQNASISDIKSQLDILNNLLKNMTDKQLKEFADYMNSVADSISEDKQLKNLINEFAKALNSTDSEQIDKKLQQLSDRLDKLASENQSIKDAIQNINQALGSNKNSTQNSDESQAGNQSSSSEAENLNGNFDSNLDGNSNGDSKNPSGNGRGTGTIENENIYTRQLENISGTEFKIDGKQDDSGQAQLSNNKVFGQKGETVSYDRVYQQYRQEALKSLSEDSIPDSMKDLVEQYFSSLE